MFHASLVPTEASATGGENVEIRKQVPSSVAVKEVCLSDGPCRRHHTRLHGLMCVSQYENPPSQP